MKTLADFKRRLKVGNFVQSNLFWKKLNEDAWDLVQYHPKREISIVQSNAFAVKTWKESLQRYEDSWCTYPKAKDFKIIDENTVEIIDDTIKLIYKFL